MSSYFSKSNCNKGSNMNVLITGANGFVGESLIKSFLDTQHQVIACVRNGTQKQMDCEYRFIDTLDQCTDWTEVLRGIDIIVHCAARVSSMSDNLSDSIEEFRKVNTLATINLAEQAITAGVKRLIFLSSIKVNGEYTLATNPFSESVISPPSDPYGLSKYEAEQGLLNIAENSALEVVIVRPTLIYGENVKGNIRALMKWTYKGIPLPLGGIKQNLRSLVSLDNLAAFIITCVDHEQAKNEVFLVSDDNDISTAMLLQQIADGLEVKNRAINIPPILLTTAASMLGKNNVAQRLCGSLHVDISKAKTLLNWQPKYSTSESIQHTSQNYIKNLNGSNKSLRELQRMLDIIFSFIGLVFTLPILVTILVIGYFDTGSPLFIQERVGRHKKPFNLVKFRTMKVNTASLASHLVDGSSITKFGKFLRKTKLDELPQLYNVLKGDMSLIGPRPNLFNQSELIGEREQMGVYEVLPGITGLSQLSNIDMSTPKLLAKTDKKMIDTTSVKNYFSYIVRTALGQGSGDAIK